MMCGRRKRWWLVAALIAASSQPLRATGAEDELRLVLNVPESRLYIYEDGERTHRYRVSVGMDGYETPPGEYRIRYAVWNPWWHPPNSAWARGRKVEPPGPSNPMGRVKLHFSNLLYIHGTAEEAWLGRPASRGCVRMANEDLLELVRFLHARATPRLPAGLLDQLERNPKQTRRIQMARPVPFSVVYRVAEVRDGMLHIFPDVYGMVDGTLRDQVTEVLVKHGVDIRTVHRAKLDRLLEKGATTRVSMPLDSLTSSGGEDRGPAGDVVR